MSADTVNVIWLPIISNLCMFYLIFCDDKEQKANLFDY